MTAEQAKLYWARFPLQRKIQALEHCAKWQQKGYAWLGHICLALENMM